MIVKYFSGYQHIDREEHAKCREYIENKPLNLSTDILQYGKSWKIGGYLPRATAFVQGVALKILQTSKVFCSQVLMKSCSILQKVSRAQKPIEVEQDPNFEKLKQKEIKKILTSDSKAKVPVTDANWTAHFAIKIATLAKEIIKEEKALEAALSDPDLNEWIYYSTQNWIINAEHEVALYISAANFCKKESEAFEAMRKQFEELNLADHLSAADKAKLLTYYKQIYAELQQAMCDPKRVGMTGGCGTADMYWLSFFSEKISQLTPNTDPLTSSER